MKATAACGCAAVDLNLATLCPADSFCFESNEDDKDDTTAGEVYDATTDACADTE